MKPRVVPALVGVLAISLAACNGAAEGHDTAATPSSPAATSSTPTTKPDKPTPKPPKPPTSPFTGERGVKKRPVLGVKIDNVSAARPQTGLALADLVYVEPVEGGLSRILAIFSSTIPKTVGPVRSARISNIALLRQFGKPALAYSGAHPGLVPLLRKAHLVTMPPTRAPRAYFRNGSRPAPHNMYAHPRRILAQAPKVSKANDIGFRFGPAPKGGRHIVRRTVHYEAADTGFRWSKKRGRWLVSMDGAPLRTVNGTRVSAPTVVVQYVPIRPSRFKGPAGYTTPHAETVGKGKAQVLRDGRVYTARWSRPRPKSGTAFKTPSGERINFHRGPVWVVIVDAEKWPGKKTGKGPGKQSGNGPAKKSGKH